MTFGDVYLCDFPLTSGAAGKVRPALVLFVLGDDVIICRVTSVMRAGPCDVELRNWQTAGLLKPSVARVDRLVTAERSVFMRRLGQLAREDADAIRNLWNSKMRL